MSVTICQDCSICGRSACMCERKCLCVCVCAGSLVHKVLPFIRKNKPAMVRLGSDVRYSEIMQEVNRDAATVATLLLTAIVVVCLKAANIL